MVSMACCVKVKSKGLLRLSRSCVTACSILTSTFATKDPTQSCAHYRRSYKSIYGKGTTACVNLVRDFLHI
jgi:hypothetical protein